MKCSIDSKTREIIFLDSSECFGVEFDKKTQKLEFSCPKIVGDNLDLSQCICRINYMNAKGYRDSYLIEDILVDGDDVTFTWTLSSKVTAGRGNCSFIFCARQVNENGVIEKEWNTTVAKASIKRGLETNSYIEEEHSDILESILSKIDKLENTEVTIDGEIANYTGKQIYEFIQSGYNVVLRIDENIYYPIVRTGDRTGTSCVEFLGIRWYFGTYGPICNLISIQFRVDDTTGRYSQQALIRLPYMSVPNYQIVYYDKYNSPTTVGLFGSVTKDDKALITGGSVYSAMINQWYVIKRHTINTNTTEIEPTINTKSFPDGVAKIYISWEDLISSSDASVNIYLNDVNITENNSLININGTKSSGWLIFEYNGLFWKLSDSFGEIPNEYKRIEGSRAKKIKIVANADITSGTIEIYGGKF